jgi:hypothetical protein
MDLLLSGLLLVVFVVAVEFTAVGSVGDGIVGLFGGLFAHPDTPPWPRGIQEDDQRLLNFSALRRWAEGQQGRRPELAILAPTDAEPDELAGVWLAAEIVDDVPPVPVSRVHRST